jgi:hypothetical protein
MADQLHRHDGERERRSSRTTLPDYFVRLADDLVVAVDVRVDERIEPKDAGAFEVTRLAVPRPGGGATGLGTA